MELVEKLNEFLSDLNVFYRKLQNYHWNVTGKDFFVMHAKLEEYYDEINEQIDEVAEHILILGGQPIGTMKQYLEKTKIAEAEDKKIKPDVIMTNVQTDLKTLVDEARKIKEMADTQNDYETSTLMDEYMTNYRKKLWMLKQSEEN